MAKSLSFRMTSQRQVILDELRNARNHPTADEIYDRVRKRLPHISLGTVYRNLEALASQGIIQKVVLSGAQRRFDGNIQQHYHIRCLECGMLRDVFIEALPSLAESVKDVGGFEISGVSLEFVGLCQACRRESDSSAQE